MVCTFTWKQNIGHLGKEIVVCGVHGHHKTMKMEFPTAVYDDWWNKLAHLIRDYKVNFLAGDFNMSLTEVVRQLKKRGLRIDTCSWYPWLHGSKHKRNICLGIASCVVFYIGGDVKREMPWAFETSRP